jgi:heat shock protein HslJ
MPKHGFQDRLGTALETLTAEELADFATQTADIAQGLGEHVTVSGLSGGGALTVWLAQERSDIDQAVPIAPFLGVGFIPARLNRPFANLLVAAPDLFQWWDPITKEKNPLSSAYQYLRYPTHALAAFLELGYATQTKARSEPPASDSILVITNAADKSINNQVVGEFVKLWQKNGRDVATYQFPAELNQPHDIITPGRPDNDIDLVYPKLLELFKVPPEQEDGKSSTTAGSEKNQETTEDTIAASPLTIESLENAEYPSGYTNSGYAKLENGEYREQAAPGSATEIIIRLAEHVVFGTLDGEQAAAIIIVSDPGGSGTFYDLALVVNKNGQTHTLATTLLGDRIKINSLEFVDNEIFVDMLAHRPDEPMSQTTLPARNHYSFEDGNLNLVKTESGEDTIGEINQNQMLIGSVWQWVSLTVPLQQFNLDDPENYTLQFLSDGTLQIKADCNLAQGTYTIDGSSSISIQTGPMTMAACPPGSRSEEFVQHLGFAAIYFFEDGHLFIDLMADGGTMKFSQGQ